MVKIKLRRMFFGEPAEIITVKDGYNWKVEDQVLSVYHYSGRKLLEVAKGEWASISVD